MISVSDLSVRAGEVVSDEQGRLSPSFTRKWNALVKAVGALGVPGGVGVRRREFPDQTLVTVSARPMRRESFAFAVKLSSMKLTVGLGLVGGIEPVIDGRRITDQDEQGRVPEITVKPEDFGKDKRCRVYLKLTTNTGYVLQQAEVIVSPTLPETVPFTAYKLIGLLLRRGEDSARVVQVAKRHLGFAAYERRADGRFRAVFWAEN